MGFVRRLLKKAGGEGGYIRVQNKSSVEVTVKVQEGAENVDGLGLDALEGVIATQAQLPTEGKSPFEDDDGDGKAAVYQYIEGDVQNRFQNDGFFVLEATPTGGKGDTCTLKLVVNHNSWTCSYPEEGASSAAPLLMVADVDEENGMWKIDIRIYHSYNPKCWMGQLGKHIANVPICQVGMPGTHDSGTYKFDKDMGASPDNDLTSTIQGTLGQGSLFGAITDVILQQIFTRLCQCQEKSFMEQLQAGIRYLDIRVVRHEESGTFWTCHGVYCVNMVEVMKEISDFLDANPKEVVILDFNHLYEFKEESHHRALLDMVYEALGSKTADRGDNDSNIGPKFPMSAFWEQKVQAIVFYQRFDQIQEIYKGKAWPMGMIHSKWPEAGDPEVLHERLAEVVESREIGKRSILLLQKIRMCLALPHSQPLTF